MRVIGCMAGTSLDGIDAAACDLALERDTLVLTPLGLRSRPYPGPVRDQLQAALPPSQTTAEALCRLDTLVGKAFAEAAAAANEELCGGGADLVVSHGQTVFHWVEDGRASGTLQLGQPAWIAERVGAPVVSDLRARDIAAGGQGAPLVPLFDVLLLGRGEGTRAALNLGGIANVTVVPPDGPVVAFDVGPGNALIDAAVLHFSAGAEAYDREGRRAARGAVDEELLAKLEADPYYARDAPKPTGKERFNAEYLLAALDGAPGLEADDVVATVTELTARTVGAACRRYAVDEVVVSGGGVRNPTLLAAIRRAVAPAAIRSSEEHGVPPQAKEAYAFAVLGFLTFHGLPGSVASCTGARAPSLLGRITPGREPLRLPEPLAELPKRLAIAG